LITTRDAQGNITKNTYDANSNLIAATDANGNISQYLYDNAAYVARNAARYRFTLTTFVCRFLKRRFGSAEFRICIRSMR
jgi:YD repeat-containing protein